MGIGISVFLLAVGAILTFAVNATVSGLDLSTIGIILMIAGAVGLATFMLVFGRRDRVGAVGAGPVSSTTVVDEEVVDEVAPRRVSRRTVI